MKTTPLTEDDLCDAESLARYNEMADRGTTARAIRALIAEVRRLQSFESACKSPLDGSGLKKVRQKRTRCHGRSQRSS